MDYFWHVLVIICTWIPGVLTYNLVFGKARILHFGPVGVTLATAYATFVVFTSTGNYTLGVLAGFAMALAISLLFAQLSYRLDSDSFGILSLAMFLGVFSIVLNWSSVTRGALGIPRIPRAPFPADIQSFALVMLGISAVWIIAMWLVSRSAFGRKLTALAEQEWYAAALGVSRYKTHTLAFLIAGVSAPFATIPYNHYLGLLHPSDYQFVALIFYVMFVVAGKPGSILGVTLSTVLLVSLKEALRFVPIEPTLMGPYRLILFGLILFGAVWWRRDVLFPKPRSI